MHGVSRRGFLQATAAGVFASRITPAEAAPRGEAQPGDRPPRADGVTVLNPRGRVPVSLIIDDSTCLVNLAHFCIPQFAEVFPTQYKQSWRDLPRGIPDSFVRKFGDWCAEHGVKGKYSVIPYPACVGWIDREMPGWSRQELRDSLELIRTGMVPHWDVHPEMVTHTRVINTRTGRPHPEISPDFMENWGWSVGKSTDELADYLAYALTVLKNAGLPCEGVTTPGGFGNQSRPEMSRATLQACRDVYRAEVPHYFRHLFTDDRSVAPRVEYASGLDGNDPRCVVSIIGCTGDWFGGWDGLAPGRVDQFIADDGKGGRLPEVIRRGEPAIMVCHWPGIYFNGREIGFNIFKEIVRRLEQGYDNLIWMKLSEIARYWAAKELTRTERQATAVALHAPFASPQFTVRVERSPAGTPRLVQPDRQAALTPVERPLQLTAGKFHRTDTAVTVCFDLPKGSSRLEFA